MRCSTRRDSPLTLSNLALRRCLDVDSRWWSWWRDRIAWLRHLNLRAPGDDVARRIGRHRSFAGGESSQVRAALRCRLCLVEVSVVGLRIACKTDTSEVETSKTRNTTRREA